jgi:hypothetical protein
MHHGTTHNPHIVTLPIWFHPEWEEELCSVCPKLSFQQRISGCLICMALGFIISMGSTFRLVKLLEGHPDSFAIMYTAGNLLGIFSTCFLYGPLSQVKKMFSSTRSIICRLPQVTVTSSDSQCLHFLL